MSLASHHDWFLVDCAAGTVLLLLLLIARVRLHPALALAVAALTLGVASGMSLKQVPISFAGGVGNLMGHIAIVLGLGAVLGRLLAASGGAASLGKVLVEGCRAQHLPWALLGLGVLVGMPVFFEVGLVLLMPIVAEVARRSGRPAILVGLPLLAGLSIVHGTLPPHPAAMLAATQYHADLGRTILFGLAAGLPAAALAGPGLSWLLLRRWEKRKAEGAPVSAEEEAPLFAPTVAEDGQMERGAEALEDSPKPTRAESGCGRGADSRPSWSPARGLSHSAPRGVDLPGQLGRRAGRAGVRRESDSPLRWQRRRRFADCGPGRAADAVRADSDWAASRQRTGEKADCGVL